MTVIFGQDTICRHHNIAATCRECNPYAVARNTDPETSHQAAASVSHIRDSQALVLSLLREQGPMTDDRIYQFHRITKVMSPSGARTRRAELVDRGLVEAVGTETLPSGRRATRWAAR